MVPTTDDSFISDGEEEYCPLCVEEMDISDKNFKPCPCGYQICQFCYNNIKQNPELNGRCPGCRRLYDDESVEYKTISAEEYRLQQLKKERRERDKKQREKEKKETEMANKKHLAGLRVVQKNLVYVTGLNPPCPPEDLHSVLRSDKYFGQYGKISKIVINKKTPHLQQQHHHPSSSNPGLVVYVTFARKEDALKCINELDGSLCDGRILRAAHGTTKYCSSYLRGHPCPNPNCMFLHEPGEEADSYTRKDLSTQQGIKMGMMGMTGTSSRMGSNVHNNNGHGHHHNDSEEEDGESHASDDDHANNSQIQQHHHHPNHHYEPHKDVLPATASWAKAGSSSASSSPQVNNNIPLANSAAFPTLGEIFRDQKQQQSQQQQQQPRKEVVKPKGGKLTKLTKDSVLLPDEVDIDDDSVLNFVDSVTDQLRSLEDGPSKMDIEFKPFSNANGKILPLFEFNKHANYRNDELKPEEEALLARQVIEKFLLRPIKNYHLAYQNHPIVQQQALLQRQQQQAQQQQHVQQQLQQQQQAQAQQQQTPNLQAAQLQQLQQLQLEQQKRLLEAEGNLAAVEQQKQAQQQLLLLQLQQQQAQQQAQQISMLRANERGNTSTPPPPGLFSGNANNNVVVPKMATGQIPQGVGIQQRQYNDGVVPTTVAPSAVPSSSSQLLTQLMSGKR
ncbi:NOT4 [[Candida] subhashii]|uniref:NOT4 n=1 Tax=[Candida] subhashii TaxID=561895 RepID=A0A8J5QTW0_9ASCO|nr:NOT4 [[Candida] subhashii]KAG7662515.1 NOT4 [[Candida] subhashii]